MDFYIRVNCQRWVDSMYIYCPSYLHGTGRRLYMINICRYWKVNTEYRYHFSISRSSISLFTETRYTFLQIACEARLVTTVMGLKDVIKWSKRRMLYVKHNENLMRIITRISIHSKKDGDNIGHIMWSTKLFRIVEPELLSNQEWQSRTVKHRSILFSPNLNRFCVFCCAAHWENFMIQAQQ